MDVFVVIQKGELNMFTFGEHGGSGSGVVGGGNWLVGTFKHHTFSYANSQCNMTSTRTTLILLAQLN